MTETQGDLLLQSLEQLDLLAEAGLYVVGIGAGVAIVALCVSWFSFSARYDTWF